MQDPAGVAQGVESGKADSRLVSWPAVLAMMIAVGISRRRGARSHMTQPLVTTGTDGC